MQTSRVGRNERTKNRTGTTTAGGAAWTPHFGPVPQPSPMGSVLLDARHQPTVLGPGTSGAQRSRPRGPPQNRSNIIEESLEDGAEEGDGLAQTEDDEVYASGGNLDESAWQTSPTKNLSRENSGVGNDEPDVGVVHMIRQFNQAQLNRRPGGVR